MNEKEILEVKDELIALVPELGLKGWQSTLVKIAIRILASVIIKNL